MFTIERKHEDGFNKIVLIDTSTKTSVEIIPDCGAMLHAFTIRLPDGTLNIIDSYANKNEFDSKAESEGFKGLKLSPFPCRIQHAAYAFNGKQYQFKKNLFNGSALHGLLYRETFTITGEHAGRDEANVTLVCKYTGTDSGFPFAYVCKVAYTLSINNCLTVSTTIENTEKEAMPVADGWHPYFTFKNKVDDLELQFNAHEMLEFVNLLPTGNTIPNTQFVQNEKIGNREIDNSFVLDFTSAQPLCILKNSGSGWQIEISPDKSYPFLQIYIPPHRNSIAIENLSAPPDSFNNKIGLLILEAGLSKQFITRYALKKI